MLLHSTSLEKINSQHRLDRGSGFSREAFVVMRRSKRSTASTLWVRHRVALTKRFRALRESLSLAWPRESNQREGHPSSTHSGHPALRVRARRPLVYGRTSLCVRRLAASMRPHFVLFAPTDHRRSGAPWVKRRAPARRRNRQSTASRIVGAA